VVNICTTSNTFCAYWHRRLYWSLRGRTEILWLNWEVHSGWQYMSKGTWGIGVVKVRGGSEVAIVLVLWGQYSKHCGNRGHFKWWARTVCCVTSDRYVDSLSFVLVICEVTMFWFRLFNISDYQWADNYSTIRHWCYQWADKLVIFTCSVISHRCNFKNDNSWRPTPVIRSTSHFPQIISLAVHRRVWPGHRLTDRHCVIRVRGATAWRNKTRMKI